MGFDPVIHCVLPAVFLKLRLAYMLSPLSLAEASSCP